MKGIKLKGLDNKHKGCIKLLESKFHMWHSPLDNNKKVLSNGIEKGSKALIPSGGHETISTAGAKAEWHQT